MNLGFPEIFSGDLNIENKGEKNVNNITFFKKEKEGIYF